LGKKLTIEYIRDYVLSLGYILISKEYFNVNTKIIIVDKNGYYYMSRYNHLKEGHYPNKFHKNNPYTIQNIKLWCKLNNKPFELMSEEYIGANNILKWRCLKDCCGEIFLTDFGNIQQNRGCAVCAGRQVGLSNCLATINPQLAKEWHPTLNGDLTPYDVTCGSAKKVWWICDKGHEWEASIVNRIKGNRCPYCSGLYPTKENNLLVINPELCKEWNYEKNNKLPEEYCSNSNDYAWWICCKCKYEWYAQIASRNKQHNCPKCANVIKKTTEEFKQQVYELEGNNYLVLDNYINNKTSIIIKHNIPECGHEWKIRPGNFLFGRRCPKCSESKGEKQLDIILTNYNIPHDSQYKFDDLVGIGNGLLKFDVPVFWDEDKTQLRLLIEYDGIFHYEKQYDDDGFETLKIHDELKNQYCKNNNIKLLRIPYWDFDNIEKILDKHLNL